MWCGVCDVCVVLVCVVCGACMCGVGCVMFVWCVVLVRVVWGVCDVCVVCGACVCGVVYEHLLQKCALVQNHKVIERDILQQDFGKHVRMQSELSAELEQQVMQCCWPLCKGNSDLHGGSIV